MKLSQQHNGIAIVAVTLVAGILAGPMFAQDAGKKSEGATQRPVQREQSSQPFVYEQKPVSRSLEIVPAETTKEIVKNFREGYPKIGSPRMLIYINRELVDQETGLKLAGREETVVATKHEAAREFQSDASSAGRGEDKSQITVNAGRDVTVVGSESTTPGKGNSSGTEQKVANVNKYEMTRRQADSTEYKQIVRDVEQVFGKRLRSGGASLADQRVATQMIEDRPLGSFTTPTEGEQARKDRVAIAGVADVVVEILMTTREMKVTKASGETYRTVPDIHVTAIRIKDSKIMGQANSEDVIGKKARANFVSNNFTAREIADATVLKLMEDMMLEVPQ